MGHWHRLVEEAKTVISQASSEGMQEGARYSPSSAEE